MILVVGNTKGGVGKTTLALQLALARRLAGRDVLLIDADRQGSAQIAATMRAEAGRTPALACVQLAEGKLLRAQLAGLAAKHHDTVIDVGGRDSAALRVALTLCDVALVPLAPRSVDVWALAAIAELIDEARQVRDGLHAVAVLNLADPGSTPDNVEAAAAVTDHPALRLLDTPVRRRKALANATGLGLAVEEMQPRDTKACEEVSALVAQVFTPAESYVETGI